MDFTTFFKGWLVSSCSMSKSKASFRSCKRSDCTLHRRWCPYHRLAVWFFLSETWKYRPWFSRHPLPRMVGRNQFRRNQLLALGQHQRFSPSVDRRYHLAIRGNWSNFFSQRIHQTLRRHRPCNRKQRHRLCLYLFTYRNARSKQPKFDSRRITLATGRLRSHSLHPERLHYGKNIETLIQINYSNSKTARLVITSSIQRFTLSQLTAAGFVFQNKSFASIF